jgi:hypothetical protein
LSDRPDRTIHLLEKAALHTVATADDMHLAVLNFLVADE